MQPDELLNYLEGVKQTGRNRWLACCPAHNDKTPSLSIRVLDDGRILIHDFGQCATVDVLKSIGLSLADLFPGKLTHYGELSNSRIPASDALQAIDHEALVVQVIASDFHKHRELDGETWERLSTAAQRIGAARDLAAPARMKS